MTYRERREAERGFLDAFWGQSTEMRALRTGVESAASLNCPLLVVGESGTGKEVVARQLHEQRVRALGLTEAEAPFVSVNAGALPESLAESILFGHERGAFTSARDLQLGKFELAHKGTLFIDEMQSLALPTQVKLLRVIQEKAFDRLGGRKTLPVECRLVFASNVPLELLVERRLFRRDLYYRLNVFPLYLTALRHRPEDLSALVRAFLLRLRAEHGFAAREVSDEALAVLRAHEWPGNLRELEHCLFFAAHRSGATIEPASLPGTLTGRTAGYLKFGKWDI